MTDYSYLDVQSREQLLFLSKTAENAERYDDMRYIMTNLVESSLKEGPDLTIEERNLLSVAFKNVVGARRASLRTLTADTGGNDGIDNPALLDLYKSQLQEELKQICNTILDLLNGNGESKLIKPGVQDEAQVFFLKMGGDYYRYLAECVDDEANKEKAVEFYKDALTIAESILAATHPIRLGLALNYSVCLYEIVQQKEEACKLAKKAFDEAISKLDKLEEADYKDSTLIMQLLRDNLTLWTQDENGDE